MNLAERLQLVSKSLIDKYGNNVILRYKAKSGAYNPSAGGYTIIESAYSAKAIFGKITQDELSVSGVNSSLWSSISSVATFSFDANYSLIDNNWTINDKKIIGIRKTELQNEEIIFKVYF